ncbi:MAG TPA: 2OG-Fe(II) oxygenase [Bryobacteraceae bacterium]|jgi:hypothetical protein
MNTADLWTQGYAALPGLLSSAEECCNIRALYDDASLFRSRIDMKRYRFGQGEYQYFANPLPARIAELRAASYESLVPTAREWMAALNLPAEFPDRHSNFLEICHAQGQMRPTPLLLRYREGDYNCLHQDLYGAVFFPFQVVICLSQPRVEFTGGELLLVEQQPRAQSVARVIALEQGDGAVITTRYRPAQGSRGFYRTNVKHGVSAIHTGERYTLGIIFHDAE